MRQTISTIQTESRIDEWIDELLGFAVLTGPLWLILILLPLCIWIAHRLSRRFKRPGTRFAGGVGIFLLLFALPFGDEIAGRVYLSYLCASKAGVKVYQTVKLPGNYWDANGMARFYRDFDSLLGDHYTIKYQQGRYSSVFAIEKAGYTYLNTHSGQVLGEATDFRYWGGWVRRNFSPHNSANGCVDYSQPQNRLIDLIFVREHGMPRQER